MKNPACSCISGVINERQLKGIVCIFLKGGYSDSMIRKRQEYQVCKYSDT